MSGKSNVTGARSSKLFSSNVLVCGKARRQLVRDVRSVPIEELKSHEGMYTRKQAEVDNDGFHMVQRNSQRRKLSQPTGELSVKCRRTVHQPEIGTRNRYVCLPHEMMHVHDDTHDIEDLPTEQQELASHLSLDDQSTEKQQMKTNSCNVVDSNSQKRKKARIRQQRR